METILYYANPIECTGCRWQLFSLLLDGSCVDHPHVGNQEDIYKLALNKNQQLIKSSM